MQQPNYFRQSWCLGVLETGRWGLAFLAIGCTLLEIPRLLSQSPHDWRDAASLATQLGVCVGVLGVGRGAQGPMGCSGAHVGLSSMKLAHGPWSVTCGTSQSDEGAPPTNKSMYVRTHGPSMPRMPLTCTFTDRRRVLGILTVSGGYGQGDGWPAVACRTRGRTRISLCDLLMYIISGRCASVGATHHTW